MIGLFRSTKSISDASVWPLATEPRGRVALVTAVTRMTCPVLLWPIWFDLILPKMLRRAVSLVMLMLWSSGWLAGWHSLRQSFATESCPCVAAVAAD